MSKRDAEQQASGSEEEEGPPSLMGNLRTSLKWDMSKKQLHLDVRQILESSRSLEVKYKGNLNTVSGEYQYTGHVKKLFYSNTPSLARIMAKDEALVAAGGEEPLDTDAFLPAGLRTLLFRDWALAPGVAVSSDRGAKFKYVLGLKKNPQVLKRFDSLDSWVSFKANAEYNPATSQVAGSGNVRLKLYKYNLTDRQDLKLSIGYDLSATLGGGLRRAPFFKLEENNWGVRLQHGSWQFLYDF